MPTPIHLFIAATAVAAGLTSEVGFGDGTKLPPPPIASVEVSFGDGTKLPPPPTAASAGFRA